MNRLYLMVTITNRNTVKRFTDLYKEYGAEVAFTTVGEGTAVSETLYYLGLEKTEKAVIFSVVTENSWKEIRRALENRLKIDIPGTGVAFIIPLSSIGGKKQLFFLTGNQNFEKGEESTLKDTKYELLVVIANQGYTNLIMDAARKEKAAGGTVIHAKGTGMEQAEKFLGVSIVNEKEIVFIVVKSEQKNNIMKAIMDDAGLESKAKSIVFSLPVTSTAGMRLMEEIIYDDEETKENN